jgi:hypothetical protein
MTARRASRRPYSLSLHHSVPTLRLYHFAQSFEHWASQALAIRVCVCVCVCVFITAGPSTKLSVLFIGTQFSNLYTVPFSVFILIAVPIIKLFGVGPEAGDS